MFQRRPVTSFLQNLFFKDGISAVYLSPSGCGAFATRCRHSCFPDPFIETDPRTVRELGSLDGGSVHVSHGEARDFRQTNKPLHQNLGKSSIVNNKRYIIELFFPFYFLAEVLVLKDYIFTLSVWCQCQQVHPRRSFLLIPREFTECGHICRLVCTPENRAVCRTEFASWRDIQRLLLL